MQLNNAQRLKKNKHNKWTTMKTTGISGNCVIPLSHYYDDYYN